MIVQVQFREGKTSRQGNHRTSSYQCYLLLLFALLVIFLYNLTQLHIKFLSTNPNKRKDYNYKKAKLKINQDILSQSSNTHPLLFIAVLSHWKRWKRRESIRQTWLTQCRENAHVKCLFFTDFAEAGVKERQLLKQEISKENDTILTPIVDKFAFAARLLWILQWTTSRFNFHYFLRIDDDHFLCLERLLNELVFRPRRALYWGFVHCQPTITRVDEAWLVLTRDLVDEIVNKANSTLLCHPYGDQAVALWMNNSTYNVTYFMDNKRIIHKTAGYDPIFYTKNVCEKYLSLHGVFDNEMKKLWLLWYKMYRKKLKRMPKYNITPIEPFETLCPHSKVFSTDGFYPEYRYEPKPCRLNPTWSISHSEHVAREEAGERYSSY